jgi:hypothetical protein
VSAFNRIKPICKGENMELKPQIDKKDLHLGCLNCSTAALQAPMSMLICVGFGSAVVTKDGETVYDGERDLHDGKEPKTVRDIELMAVDDPDHDWRIIKDGPLHGETFQRHGVDNWVCIESNQGFA